MKITLARLSTKDLATLVQRIVATSLSGTYPVIPHHPLLDLLQTVYTDYDLVYNKQSYSGKGKDVSEADTERDVAFRDMKAFLNGYRQLRSAPNCQDAEDLYQVFKNHGLDLDRMSYSSQTAQMEKLIEVLEEPANTVKINNLSIATAFSDMKTKHDAFELLFSQQAGANADLRQMKSASGIRRDLEKILKTFLNFVTAMKDISGWELYYADVNELVKAAKNSTQKKPKDNPEQS